VGSIGTNGGVPYLSGPLAGGIKLSYYDATYGLIFPVTTTGAIADGTHDLGYSAARFRDLYLSGTLNGISTTKSASGNRWGILPEVESNGVMEIGRYIDFHSTDGDTSDYGARLDYDGTNIVSTNAFSMASGIYLGGSVAANLLDDYEEGTWTPTLNMTSGSVSYSSQLGQYTKIGNQVTLTGWIYISGVSSPSGALNITVPFTASSTNTRPAAMIMANNTTGVTGNLGAWINPNTTDMYLQIVNNADLSSLDGSNMATNTEIYVTITYITT
jgi:hypothetical protein